MTSNQIAYWKLVEDRRHNLAMEQFNAATLNETSINNRRIARENARHNVAGEIELNRHNLATEASQVFQNLETARHNTAFETETSTHNRATESLGFSQFGETVRHNVATEAQESQRIAETARHNLAAEQEMVRAHQATEAAHILGLMLDATEQLEKQRHNTAAEAETNRSNLAQEEETKRSHLASEAEAERSHRVNEAIDAYKAMHSNQQGWNFKFSQANPGDFYQSGGIPPIIIDMPSGYALPGSSAPLGLPGGTSGLLMP